MFTSCIYIYSNIYIIMIHLLHIYVHLKIPVIFQSISIIKIIYEGSYRSAYVLLNLLNDLGKRDKMRGLPSILHLFRNEFNKVNNTRARMLDSFYHMALRSL